MDLKDKLRYYRSEHKEESPPKTNHRLEDMATRLNASIIEEDTLPVLKIEKCIPYSYIHPVLNENIQSSVHLPLLTKNTFPDPIHLKNILIFDLETTGLAGGTGTYPFLIGFGVFEENCMKMYQYFLPDFGREISAFLDMRGLRMEKNVLLSYNGKSFDYPLLRNRFILNRLDNPFEKYSHLDLLHAARRLYKQTLPSCSLETIEKHIFAFNRWKDIDGSLIPQTYFTFVHTGEISEIQRIIDHNQQDIMSLARLLFHMHQIENDGTRSEKPGKEFISIFNLAISISDMDRIEPMFKSFTREDNILPSQSLKKYSLLLKRKKKWNEALRIWEYFIERGEEVLFSCEEIAKYYEHREINLKSALNYTNRAIDFLNIISEIKAHEDLDEIRTRFYHRLNRIQNKLSIK